MINEFMDRQWHQESATWRDAMDVSPSFRPWTSRATFRGDGISATPRVLDFLDCVVSSKLKSAPATRHDGVQQLMMDTYCDYTQSHGRKNYTNRQGCNHAFTTATEMYSFGHDRVVMPTEMLSMHGYPADMAIPDNITPSELKAMAGNGIALPCLGTIMWSLYLVQRGAKPALDNAV
jgi:site-specific DNA-cytosine methylase